MALLPLTPYLLWLTSSRKSLFPLLAHQSPGESKEATRSRFTQIPCPQAARGLSWFGVLFKFYLILCVWVFCVHVCLLPVEARKSVRFPRTEL